MWRRILQDLATIGLAVLVFAVAVELTTRLVIDDGFEFDLEMWKYANALKRVSDIPGIGHEHRPNQTARLMGVDVSINAQAIRDTEYPHIKPPGSTRILMLGDSVTLGWGVKVKACLSG